jgi:hypothetical protein
VVGFVSSVQKIISAQTGKYDDFDSGRAGLLFAGHFLNVNLGAATIDPSSMLSLAVSIVNRGAQLVPVAYDNNRFRDLLVSYFQSDPLDDAFFKFPSMAWTK